MKLHSYKSASIVLALILINSQNLYAQQTTAYDQLVEVNKEWKKQDDADPILKKRQASVMTEQQLIRFHLMETEKLLRIRSTAQLTAAQKKNRENSLNTLHAYWLNGEFPKNTGHTNRQPYFIDIFNTYCAVGYLMQQSGADKMAKEINRTQNYTYLRDIKHPDLMNWADKCGLTVDELALIQPGYSCYQTSILEMHYDNAGADVNEYIEILSPANLTGTIFERIEFYDHLGVLYKTLPRTSMSAFAVTYYTPTLWSDGVYFYNFPVGESFADSGTVRLLERNISTGITSVVYSLVYNSTGISLGSGQTFPVHEDGNGPPGISLNICKTSCNPSGPYHSARLSAASHGAVDFTCQMILAETLKSFNYTLVNSSIRLQWQTASEANTDKFEVEKSTDGNNFNKIGTVASSGNSNIPKDYSFPDNNPAAINYYRLKQIDKDGKAVYSKILNVKLKNGNPLTIQPTIVTDQLRVNIGLEQREIKGFQVYDISGRAILNFTGRSGYNEINVSNFSAGSYLIRLQTADGKAYSQRFVKQ